MKSYIQYTYSCTNAMFNYLKDTNLETLISKLKQIEKHATENIGGHGASLWFKFGDNDTLATDINDIERTLSLSSSNNNKILLIEMFETVIGLEPDNELKVFFS